MATGGVETAKDTSDIEQKYQITYLTTWDKTVKEQDGELTVSKETGLLFSGHVEKCISSKSLRWIARDRELSFPTGPHDCFVVSYLDPETRMVLNIFFEIKNGNEDIIGECLRNMRQLLADKYEKSWKGDPEKIKDILQVLSTQPFFIGKVWLVAIAAQDGDFEEIELRTAQKFEFLLILDLECVCLYSGSLVRPSYELWFWEEEGSNSIDRVKLMITPGESEKTVCLQTKKMTYAFGADDKIVSLLQTLRPKKMHLMTDPILMIESLQELKPRERELPAFRTESPVGATSSGWGPFATDLVGATGSRWRQPSYTSEAGGSWNDDQSFIAQKIEGQLETAEANFRGNEDLLNMWVAIEYDIQEIINGGTVPTTDYRSGGMDADNGEHLEKALSDVQDQLRENNLPVAISRLRACRELFGTSQQSSLRKIFNKDDMDLLRALYFKSLVQ